MIADFLRRTRTTDPGVLTGIGDDAAVLEVAADKLLLATCDIQIDGVHFQMKAFSPEDIGVKSAAVNLSDIAAMGGVPRFALVSLAIPPETEATFLHRLYDSLQRSLRLHGAEIVGGNTAALPERLAIDVTLIGEVERDAVLRRSGASPGDVLCVTGPLGASRAGLMLLEEGAPSVETSHRMAALGAHRTPIPRVREGRTLSSTHWVSACIDVSDGLLGDARHLSEESGARIVIDTGRVPIADCAIAVARAAKVDAIDLALLGGEDYELLFTVPKNALDHVTERLLRETGTSAVPIGEVVDGPTELLLRRNGKCAPPDDHGFDHFIRGRDLQGR